LIKTWRVREPEVALYSVWSQGAPHTLVVWSIALYLASPSWVLVSVPGNTPENQLKTGSVITQAYTGEDKKLERKTFHPFLTIFWEPTPCGPQTRGDEVTSEKGDNPP